jgi:Arc/MetJ-type ribon-helix-helix transcriptional regulator
MNIRNAKYNENGAIDCEIEHPEFGWIPFTASPDDVEQHGRDIYEALIDAGNVSEYAEPVKTAVQLTQEFEIIKEQQKERLRTEKLDSMLSVEFAEIDAATTEADIEKVKLK